MYHAWSHTTTSMYDEHLWDVNKLFPIHLLLLYYLSLTFFLVHCCSIIFLLLPIGSWFIIITWRAIPLFKTAHWCSTKLIRSSGPVLSIYLVAICREFCRRFLFISCFFAWPFIFITSCQMVVEGSNKNKIILWISIWGWSD